MQEQTGIPYVLINGRFESTPASLRLVGEILGAPEHGEAPARNVEETFARVDAILAETPEEARPGTYLALGPDALETGVESSINGEIIERAGGRNGADGGGAAGELVRVSPEQVLAADPEVIVTWDRGSCDRVRKDPLWAEVAAMREGRVNLSPTAPFDWIDRPPSISWPMGLKWMAGLLHRDRWRGNLCAEAQAFHRLCNHVDLPLDADRRPA